MDTHEKQTDKTTFSLAVCVCMWVCEKVYVTAASTKQTKYIQIVRNMIFAVV